MPLNDTQLKAHIIQIQDTVRQAVDYETSKELYAQMLVDAIKAYLQSGTIAISGTSNAGAFTGTGTIT